MVDPKRVTVDTLFGETPVVPLPASRLRFNANGSHLAFLVPAEDARGRLDLWLADCAEETAQCLLDARQLHLGSTSATDRERQERLRQFASGVTTYEWFPDGHYLLVPIGDLVLRVALDGQYTAIDLPRPERGDLRVSNSGRWLTYVANGNLYTYEIATQIETAVTEDGGGTVSYGLAEFIAQEEMHRFEGYWWAPDDSRLVYTRVDDSTIPESNRLELVADEVVAVVQRYAYAGGPNARVSLHALDLRSRQVTELDIGLGVEDYLARVNFVGNRLTVQVQHRDQQWLALRGEAVDGRWTTWTTETSPTWINLNDHLRTIGTDHYLWTSERDGPARLFVGQANDDKPLRPASPPDLHVCSVLGTSETTVWVQGWQVSPTERHFYAIDLKSSSATQLTMASGWHEGTWHTASERYATTWSDINTPPEVRLYSLEVSSNHRALHVVSPAHPAREFAAVSPVFGTLLAVDGQTLQWRVTPPLDAENPGFPGQRFPVIVYVYGGPGAQKVCNAWPPALLQLLSHAGFGVLEVDNRGSGNRGRWFEAPLFRHMGGVEVDDQLEGLRVLEQFTWADTSRVGIFGHSYGGFMTLMCLSRAGDRFKAGIAVAPVCDWRLYDTHYTERYLGNPAEDPAPYDASCVLPHLVELHRPLLLVHGMADDNVLITHSTRVMRELQRLGKPFELMLYPGSRHGLQERDVSRHRFNQLIDFFGRRL